jgi:hypothetical protein
MDRLWCRKVSSSLISNVLTSSAICRDSIDGVFRDTFSICSSSVSNSRMKWDTIADIQAKPADEILVCAEYD